MEAPDQDRLQDLLVNAYFDAQDDAAKYKQLLDKIGQEQLNKAIEVLAKGVRRRNTLSSGNWVGIVLTPFPAFLVALSPVFFRRVAQGESTSLTRKGSAVQIRSRLPSVPHRSHDPLWEDRDEGCASIATSFPPRYLHVDEQGRIAPFFWPRDRGEQE